MPDHPRRRGELQASSRAALTTIGSSPQARGTPRARIGTGRGSRIIPAGAGNSPAQDSS